MERNSFPLECGLYFAPNEQNRVEVEVFHFCNEVIRNITTWSFALGSLTLREANFHVMKQDPHRSSIPSQAFK